MRYYGSLIDRARHARKNVEFSTQRIRSKLLSDLEKMFDMAKAHATNESVNQQPTNKITNEPISQRANQRNEERFTN